MAASHVGNTHDLLRAIKSNRPLIVEPFGWRAENPKQTVQHHALRASHTRWLGESFQWRTHYNFQWNHRREFGVRRGVHDSVPAVDVRLATHEIHSRVESRLASDFRWQAGINLQYQDNYASPDTGLRRLIPDYLRAKNALYGTGEWLLGPRWTAAFGLRYEHDFVNAKQFYTIQDWEQRGYSPRFSKTIIRTTPSGQYLAQPIRTFNNLSSSLDVRHRWREHYQAFLNIWLSNRSPNVSELFSDGLHHALASIERGDLRLDSETALKVLLSLEGGREPFQFSLSAYYSHIDDYILLGPSGVEQTVRGGFPVWTYRQANIVMGGATLDFSLLFTKFLKGRHTAAFVGGVERRDQKPLPSLPPLSIDNTLTFCLPRWESFSLELRSQYAFKQHRFPDDDFTVVILEQGALMKERVALNTPPPGYHVLGFHLGYRFALIKASQARLSLAVDNATNTP